MAMPAVVHRRAHPATGAFDDDGASMRLREPRVLAAVIAAGALLTVLGKYAGLAWMVWAFKPLTTATLCWVAWRRGLAGDRYARLVTAGLVLSLAGDVLLIESSLFVAGLVAFLLAHLCYIAAFATSVGLFPRLQPFGAAAVVSGAVLLVLWPSLPGALRLPVIAYVLALGTMVGQAHARAAIASSRENRLAAVGATLFLFSDAMLAIDRFHTPFWAAPLVVLGSYWAAQTLITLSIPDADLEPEPLRVRG
jgi:uncharacterized membrane protein YhhN